MRALCEKIGRVLFKYQVCMLRQTDSFRSQGTQQTAMLKSSEFKRGYCVNSEKGIAVHVLLSVITDQIPLFTCVLLGAVGDFRLDKVIYNARTVKLEFARKQVTF